MNKRFNIEKGGCISLVTDNFYVCYMKRRYKTCEEGATFQFDGVLITKGDKYELISFISRAVRDHACTVDGVVLIDSTCIVRHDNSAQIDNDFDYLIGGDSDGYHPDYCI
jgi:hypothetical protein